MDIHTIIETVLSAAMKDSKRHHLDAATNITEAIVNCAISEFAGTRQAENQPRSNSREREPQNWSFDSAKRTDGSWLSMCCQ